MYRLPAVWQATETKKFLARGRHSPWGAYTSVVCLGEGRDHRRSKDCWELEGPCYVFFFQRIAKVPSDLRRHFRSLGSPKRLCHAAASLPQGGRRKTCILASSNQTARGRPRFSPTFFHPSDCRPNDLMNTALSGNPAKVPVTAIESTRTGPTGETFPAEATKYGFLAPTREPTPCDGHTLQ